MEAPKYRGSHRNGVRSGKKRKPFQPWPFYRKTHFDAEMQAQVEDVWRQMDEGYDTPIRSDNPRLARPDYGEVKYELKETPRYLKGRERMRKKGHDLGELDFIVSKLLHGERLSKGNHPHRLRGDKKGLMECHIGGRDSDWVLVYQYDDDALILHALDTGMHKECGVD